MKKTLLKILICPACQGALQLKAFSYSDKKEMLGGTLTCTKCDKWYPLINGIPRMLPLSMINGELLSDFLEKYRDKLPLKRGRKTLSETEKMKKRTSESFGFQWRVFSEMFKEYEANFLNYVKPLKPSFFRRKLVLDAGCGFGRHTHYAAKYGAEVVGFDLSDAVEAAYENCRKFPAVHIVQGDIYHPPFRKKFDLIMSIGVLHHLPDPKRGYLELVKLARHDTTVFAWLYGKEGRAFKTVFLEKTIRRVTVHMPKRMLYYFCYLPAGIYHISNALHNFLAGYKATKGIADRLPFKNYAKFPFRVKLADAYDFLGTPINNYYTSEECENWTKEAGLKDVSVTSLGGRSWRISGRK